MKSLVDVTETVPEGIDTPEIYPVALKILKGSTEDAPINTSVLVEKVAENLTTALAGYLIYRSLMQASRLPASRIRSRKGRNGGYFLASAEVIEPDTLPTQADKNKEKTLEKHLWPAAADWLRLNKSIGHVSHDIANIKKGGIWANPDVVGINIIEDLGLFDVEITTLEVKPSLNQWRYYFFEAVAHKRFSERVYFVYRGNAGGLLDHRESLVRYAEKYGVGIVELQIDDDGYKKISDWNKLTDADRTEIIDSFVEVVPAPFEAISIREKIDFLKQLGVNSKRDLYSFGARP